MENFPWKGLYQFMDNEKMLTYNWFNAVNTLSIYTNTYIFMFSERFYFFPLLNLICNTCSINHAIKWSPILQKHSFLFSLWLMLRHFSYSHSLFWERDRWEIYRGRWSIPGVPHWSIYIYIYRAIIGSQVPT